MPKELAGVLGRVEEERGIPVDATTDPSLPTLASIRSARAPANHHVPTCNPTKPGVNYYHVAYAPKPEHGLGSLPGELAGLRLVWPPFVGFEGIDPGHDMAFDLSREHETAQRPFVAKKG